MLGPAAAIVDRRAGGGQLHPGAIDEPGARRVDALKRGKIEEHALRVLGRRDERSAGWPPSSCPAVTIHVPAKARTTPPWALDELRTARGHQALRPETALLSRDPAPCRDDTRGVAGSGISATTNQVRIGDPARGTPIREQSESNLCARTAAPALRIAASSSPCSFPATAGSEPEFAADAKRQRISDLPNCRPLQSFVAASWRCQAWLANCCLPMSVRAPIWDRGEGTGDKRGQNRRRAASLDFSARKAMAIGAPARAGSGHGAQCVNSTLAAGVNPSSPP